MSNKKTFLDLIGERDFMKKIVEMQDESEVIKAFEDEGVTPTKEDMDALKSILNKTCDQLAKYSKEEIKQLKEVYDNLTNKQLLEIAGGVKNKQGGEEVEEKVGSLLTTEVALAPTTGQTFADYAGKVWGEIKEVGDKFLLWRQGENDVTKARIAGDVTKDNNATTRQLSKDKTTVMMAGMGAAAALTTLYMFKDDIKGWFKKFKK